jgi:hypothetical protein
MKEHVHVRSALAAICTMATVLRDDPCPPVEGRGAAGSRLTGDPVGGASEALDG